MFGLPPSAARGYVARRTDWVLTSLSVLLEVGLLMVVVDATYWCYRFVSYLTNFSGVLKWPADLENRHVAEWVAQNPSMANEELKKAMSPLLRVDLIAEVTDVVARMIYYPFIVLLVLILGQNTYFDNVELDIPLTIVVVLSAVTALCCAVMLQAAARKAKRKAVDEVRETGRRFAGEPFHVPLADKINQIRLEMEHKKSEAFLPLYAHPTLKALLIPLGGAGGVALLQALFG
jgi:hypothetical protein